MHVTATVPVSVSVYASVFVICCCISHSSFGSRQVWLLGLIRAQCDLSLGVRNRVSHCADLAAFALGHYLLNVVSE